MKILVTGGAGFIGSNLVYHLLDKTLIESGLVVESVVTLDKLTYAGHLPALADVADDPRHHFIHGDVCDSANVSAVLREHRINAIMHLASESHVDRSIANPEDFVMTNYVGTYRLLEAFRRHLAENNSNCDRNIFLHVSTDEVFGTLDPGDSPFNEDSPYAPNSPYSASKAGSDHMARAYHRTYGLPVVTTHCSNNYGPWQNSEKLIPHMIRMALRGGPLPVYGDGSQIRDWIHVSDHCRALTTVLARGVPGRNYVIGGNCEIRNIDLVRQIVEIVTELAPDRITRSADELIAFVTDRPGHDCRYALNPSRITRELGWRAIVDFQSGLRETIQWYLDHPEQP